jgi:hypothetical protein
MTIILTDEQKVSLSIKPLTAAGNPARVDGIPAWAVSDTNVLSLVVAPDGLSAVAVANGPIGLSQVSVVADADLGAGVKELVATLDVQVVPAEAVSLGVTAGAPELK